MIVLRSPLERIMNFITGLFHCYEGKWFYGVSRTTMLTPAQSILLLYTDFFCIFFIVRNLTGEVLGQNESHVAEISLSFRGIFINHFDLICLRSYEFYHRFISLLGIFYSMYCIPFLFGDGLLP